MATDNDPDDHETEDSVIVAAHRTSSKVTALTRNQIRQELIQELLEACSNDAQKRQIVTELADKVLHNTGSSSDDESDDDNIYKWTDVESMEEIQDTPYEVGASAEVGEEMFEEFKALLEPEELTTERRRSGTGTLTATKKAMEVLGPARAEAMVTANHHIAESGMVFSPSWISGSIRGMHIQGLTKVMLLLCLQEQRLARAEKGVMNKLVEDLRLADIVREVLDDLEGIGTDQFPKLSKCLATPLPYQRSHRYECQKCELFVARTFACMNFLKRDQLENKIVIKMLACLRVMEAHLQVASNIGRPPTHIQTPIASIIDGDDNRLESPSLMSPLGNGTHHEGKSSSHKTTAIEQLDLNTGEVLARFPSVQAANLAIGKNENSAGIKHNIAGRRKYSYGFFWRKVGSSELPADVKPVNTPQPPNQLTNQDYAIEMLDMKSGQILRTFPSVQAANISLGKRKESSGIRDNLSGRSRSAHGYSWRKCESSRLSNQIKPVDDEPSSCQLENKDCSAEKLSNGKGRSLPKTSSPDQQRLNSSEKIHRNNGEELASSPSIQEANLRIEKEANKSGTAKNLWGRLRSSENFFLTAAGSSTASESLEPLIGAVSTMEEDAQHDNTIGKKRRRHDTSNAENDSRKTIRQLRYDGTPDDLEVAPPRELALDPNQGHLSMREISAMNDIIDSPYQVDSTAEVGEDIFENFNALLVPAIGRSRGPMCASEAAIEILGKSLAGAVLEASTKIALSGMVYSTEWKDGIFRGIKIGPIPSRILLLLLQEQRFSRPGVTGALVKVVIDFELCRTMIKALVRWNMVDKYPKVSQATTHALFTAQKVQCYKCLIFIARVFNCMKILDVELMSESLKGKVEACFQILETNLGHRTPRPISREKARNKTLNHEAALSFSTNDDDSTGSIAAACSPTNPPKEINMSSHILFQIKPSTSDRDTTQGTSRRASSRIKAAPGTKTKLPGQVVGELSAKTSLASVKPLQDDSKRTEKPIEGNDLTSWVPYDAKEVILSPVETETAWLIEESIYSLRTREIQWRFVWKYASPTLRIELRKIFDGSGDELEHLVRLRDNIVATRFANLRREIRRKLHRAQYRPRMEKSIPEERIASRQLMDNDLAQASEE